MTLIQEHRISRTCAGIVKASSSRPMPDPIETARIDLAAALRWADRLGLSEGICNHFSVVVANPDGGAPDRFLINPPATHWREVTAGSLLLVGFDGSLIEGACAPEETALYIHYPLHAGAPQAACVLHTHMPYATALTTIEEGRLEPTNQTSLMFHDRIAYDDDYGGLALDASEGARMCAALGNKQVLFLANHGVIVTGASVAEAFDQLYYLERAAMIQVLAMSTGRPLKRIPEAMIEKTVAQLAEGGTQTMAHLDAIKRILDREAPDYRN